MATGSPPGSPPGSPLGSPQRTSSRRTTVGFGTRQGTMLIKSRSFPRRWRSQNVTVEKSMFSYRSTQVYLLGTEVSVHKNYKASEKRQDGKYPFYFEIKTPEEPYLLRCRASSQKHLDFWIETLQRGGCSYYPPLNQVLMSAGIPLDIEETNSTPAVRERIQRSSSWSGREHKEEQDAARSRVKDFDDDFRISVIKKVGKKAWQGLQFTERLECLEEAMAAMGRKSPRASTLKITPLEDSIVDHPLLQTSEQAHRSTEQRANSPSHRQTPHRSTEHLIKETVEVEPKTPVPKSGIDLGELGFSTGRNKKKDKLASGIKHKKKYHTSKKAKKSHFQTSQGATLKPHPPSFSTIETGATEEGQSHDTPTATSRVVLNIGALSAVEQTSPRKRQKVKTSCNEELNKQREQAWVKNTSVRSPTLSGVSPMRVKISLPLPRTKKMKKKKTASATGGIEQSKTKSKTSNKRMTAPVRRTASNRPATAAVRRETQPRVCTVRQVSSAAVARWSVDQNQLRNMRPTELRKFEVAERRAFHRTRIKQITEGSSSVPQTRASLDSILRAHHNAGMGDGDTRSFSKSNRGQTNSAAQKGTDTEEAESVRRAVAKCLPKHYGDSVLASRHCYVSSTLHSSGNHILYSHPAEYTAPVQFSESTKVHSPTTNHIVISPMTPTSKRTHPLVSHLERLSQSSSSLNESKNSSLFNESVHTYTSGDLASASKRPFRQNTVQVNANAGSVNDLKIEQLSPIEKSDSEQAAPHVKSPRRQTWAANQPSSWSLQSPVRRNSPLQVQSDISQLSPGTATHARFKKNKQETISLLKSDIAALDLKLSYLKRK